VEVLVDGAERYLALRDRQASHTRSPARASGTRRFGAGTLDARAFAAMPEEIRLRLLLRAINRFGHEGPAELGKVEALLAALDRAIEKKSARSQHGPKLGLKQTLAGAMVSLTDGRIRIEPAPPRRGRAS
jgi:tRNA(Ile)-lysidine synthase